MYAKAPATHLCSCTKLRCTKLSCAEASCTSALWLGCWPVSRLACTSAVKLASAAHLRGALAIPSGTNTQAIPLQQLCNIRQVCSTCACTWGSESHFSATEAVALGRNVLTSREKIAAQPHRTRNSSNLHRGSLRKCLPSKICQWVGLATRRLWLRTPPPQHKQQKM